MNSVYGNYRTRTFNDIYPTFEDFKDDVAIYNSIGLNPNFKEDTNQTLFYLLSARYGNSSVANSDENQFKLKLFSTIFQYGPTWEKRLSIQTDLRALTEDELLT
ncbi:MAG: hypothetical protein PUJ51_13510, partial [Clostridiales bacterium]|uniref:hypothetical protein n=1 Tax=Terrisporobacter sp. TaxID=1965305 RepID=UPI002A593ECF